MLVVAVLGPGGIDEHEEACDGQPQLSVMTVRLPVPRFTRKPMFFLGLAALHLYLGSGHILSLFHSAVTWTDIWKGVGATTGAYYFMALWLRAREPLR